MTNKEKFSIPKEVAHVTSTLEEAGFEAYLVGGCVRDIMLGLSPSDWDIATDAHPERTEDLFEHSHYDNEFGTVRVVSDETEDPTLKVIEVTTYRQELGYSDNRRPDVVEFSDNLEDDLKRRDFTINALAAKVSGGTNPHVTRDKVVDMFDGKQDLDKKFIKTVGDPHERFSEDALRLMRAIRFAAQLDFDIEGHTKLAVVKHSETIKEIAVERVREEFIKVIMSKRPRLGLELMEELKVMSFILPELEAAQGIEQNQAHSFDVWEHLLGSVQATADKDWPLHVRLAALFHDIGKPETRRWSEENQDWTFYGHEVVGTRVTKKILKRLKFPKDLSKKVLTLVRWHMFFSDPDEISYSAVRRLVRRVGKDLIWDLMDLRVADRIGTGRPKEKPYRLRKYKSMVEEVMSDPLSVQDLKISGDEVMDTLEESSGPRIGHVLKALMNYVLEDPDLNKKDTLIKKTLELGKLKDDELRLLAQKGEERLEKREAKRIKSIRDKYHVK